MSWEQILGQTTQAYGQPGLALHLDVAPRPSSVGLARDYLRRQLAGHDQAGLDVITLLLSELLTNAILHGGGRVSVDVSVQLRANPVVDSQSRSLGLWGPDPVTAILVGVSDASSQLPKQRPGLDLPEDGLGLQIVGQLSDGWGTIPLADSGGKIVWFLVNVRDESAADQLEVGSQFSTWPTA